MSAQAIRLTEVDIDNALANDHLDVVFQPLFSLEDGTLARMEAFIRWDHPGLGVLPPGAFISFFEAQGRMGELTRYVLRRAVTAYTRWRGTSGPGFSVNLAQSDLIDESFAAEIGGILGAAGMPVGLVTLECPPLPPEMASDEALGHLRRLQGTGCPLAAEVRGRASDFLQNADPFPFAEIKTGGSTILRFARTARGGPGLEAVSDLVDLAKRHEARIVAVGVEDEESALALRRLGFGAAQGNLLSAATPLEAFSAQTINTVRGVIGLDAMSQDELAATVGRDGSPEPLVLGAPEATAAPEAPSDTTALAIQRLKARKIAAKRAALRRAQEDRARAEAEVEAARQASDTARRLQERLAAELDGDAEPSVPADQAPEPSSTTEAEAEVEAELATTASEGSAQGEVRAAPSGDAAAPAADPDDDDEAGTLLTENLAEVALGVSHQASFAEGLRLEGYASSVPVPHAEGGAEPALMGAVAPDAAPEVRTLGQPAARFSSVSEAIHAILDELPVPEDAKAGLRESAVKPLDLAALEKDKSPEDLLDAVVAQSPMIEETVPAEHEDAPAPTEAMAAKAAEPAAPASPRRPRQKTLLTRRYRITHFWPRAWVRTVRRVRAAHAAPAAPSA